jgi:hypothetical protein
MRNLAHLAAVFYFRERKKEAMQQNLQTLEHIQIPHPNGRMTRREWTTPALLLIASADYDIEIEIPDETLGRESVLENPGPVMEFLASTFDLLIGVGISVLEGDAGDPYGELRRQIDLCRDGALSSSGIDINTDLQLLLDGMPGKLILETEPLYFLLEDASSITAWIAECICQMTDERRLLYGLRLAIRAGFFPRELPVRFHRDEERVQIPTFPAEFRARMGGSAREHRKFKAAADGRNPVDKLEEVSAPARAPDRFSNAHGSVHCITKDGEPVNIVIDAKACKKARRQRSLELTSWDGWYMLASAWRGGWSSGEFLNREAAGFVKSVRGEKFTAEHESMDDPLTARAPIEPLFPGTEEVSFDLDAPCAAELSFVHYQARSEQIRHVYDWHAIGAAAGLTEKHCAVLVKRANGDIARRGRYAAVYKEINRRFPELRAVVTAVAGTRIVNGGVPSHRHTPHESMRRSQPRASLFDAIDLFGLNTAVSACPAHCHFSESERRRGRNRDRVQMGADWEYPNGGIIRGRPFPWPCSGSQTVFWELLGGRYHVWNHIV